MFITLKNIYFFIFIHMRAARKGNNKENIDLYLKKYIYKQKIKVLLYVPFFKNKSKL